MPEGKALVLAARIPEKTVVQFHVRDARSAWAELDKLLEVAASRTPTSGSFDVLRVGRGQRLFGESGHDSRVIRQHFGDLSVAGFFGNGEIGLSDIALGSTAIRRRSFCSGLLRTLDEGAVALRNQHLVSLSRFGYSGEPSTRTQVDRV